MSHEAKNARRKIADLQDDVAMHSVYVYLGKLSNNETTEHWKNELFTWLNKINRITLKPKLKKFSFETYYEILFSEPLNNGKENWLRNTRSDIKHKEINIKITDLELLQMYMRLDLFFKAICLSLANNTFSIDIFNNAIDVYLI